MSAFEPLQAVVYKEHTLGLVRGTDLEILHTSVLRGSPHNINQGPLHYSPEDCRPATKQDFVEYRVMWNPDYIVVEPTQTKETTNEQI